MTRFEWPSASTIALYGTIALVGGIIVLAAALY
jgi:hypothetical protein